MIKFSCLKIGGEVMMTPKKEKYLMEIYLNINEEGYTRISQLAKSLQVSVPAVSKMVKKLYEEEYIVFQRYGMITLTKKGRAVCEELLNKRIVLSNFLRFIGIDEEHLEEEVKAIEHSMSFNVIIQIERFLTNNQMLGKNR